MVLKKFNVNEQTHDASTFDLMNVKECYCKIGSEFYTEDRMNIIYGTKNYNKAFKKMVTFKDYNGLPHNIKPYINHRTFKSIYRIHVFDTRYQSDHIGPQPIYVLFLRNTKADFPLKITSKMAQILSLNRTNSVF